MNKELATKLIDQFVSEAREPKAEFFRKYKQLADSMAAPIQKLLDASEVRKTCKDIVLLTPGQTFNLSERSYVITDLNPTVGRAPAGQELPFVTVQLAKNELLREFTADTLESMLHKVANNLIRVESECFEALINKAKINATLVIKHSFQMFDDPALLRRLRVGVYGWQTFGMFCPVRQG